MWWIECCKTAIVAADTRFSARQSLTGGRECPVYVEQVPDQALKLATMQLLDADGVIVLEVALPAHQQTRFSLRDVNNPNKLVNRLEAVAQQSVASAGDLMRVRQVALTRSGSTELVTIPPEDHDSLRWTVSMLRFRKGCKGM